MQKNATYDCMHYTTSALYRKRQYGLAERGFKNTTDKMTGGRVLPNAAPHRYRFLLVSQCGGVNDSSTVTF